MLNSQKKPTTQKGYQIEPKPLKFDERFKRFAELHLKENQLGIQCGPSSRTRHRMAQLDEVNGVFSVTFAITSTKLLIRKEKASALYPQPYADNGRLRIGVLKSSVTSLLIEKVFPNADIIYLEARQDGINGLRADTLLNDGTVNRESIDAYASDEIILAEMLNADNKDELGSQRDRYTIEPRGYGYSLEEYALALFNASPQLLDKMNTWLQSAEGRAAAARFEPQEDRSADGLLTMRMLLGMLFMFGILLILFTLWHYRHRWLGRMSKVLDPKQNFADGPISGIQLQASKDSATAETDRVVSNATLTPRETEVLALLVKGNTNKGIARELDVSPRTIETHRKNIYTKLGVSTPYELVEYARQQSLM